MSPPPTHVGIRVVSVSSVHVKELHEIMTEMHDDDAPHGTYSVCKCLGDLFIMTFGK